MSIVKSRLSELADPQFDYDSVALTTDGYGKYLDMARRLHQRQTGKLATFDAADEDHSRIREWLGRVPLKGRVIVLWIGLGEGIACDYDRFVSNYDHLWYPASDDTWITNIEGTMLLEMDHEEQFSWRE